MEVLETQLELAWAFAYSRRGRLFVDIEVYVPPMLVMSGVTFDGCVISLGPDITGVVFKRCVFKRCILLGRGWPKLLYGNGNVIAC